MRFAVRFRGGAGAARISAAERARAPPPPGGPPAGDGARGGGGGSAGGEWPPRRIRRVVLACGRRFSFFPDILRDTNKIRCREPRLRGEPGLGAGEAAEPRTSPGGLVVVVGGSTRRYALTGWRGAKWTRSWGVEGGYGEGLGGRERRAGCVMRRATLSTAPSLICAITSLDCRRPGGIAFAEWCHVAEHSVPIQNPIFFLYSRK